MTAAAVRLSVSPISLLRTDGASHRSRVMDNNSSGGIPVVVAAVVALHLQLPLLELLLIFGASPSFVHGIYRFSHVLPHLLCRIDVTRQCRCDTSGLEGRFSTQVAQTRCHHSAQVSRCCSSSHERRFRVRAVFVRWQCSGCSVTRKFQSALFAFPRSLTLNPTNPYTPL